MLFGYEDTREKLWKFQIAELLTILDFVMSNLALELHAERESRHKSYRMGEQPSQKLEESIYSANIENNRAARHLAVIATLTLINSEFGPRKMRQRGLVLVALSNLIDSAGCVHYSRSGGHCYSLCRSHVDIKVTALRREHLRHLLFHESPLSYPINFIWSPFIPELSLHVGCCSLTISSGAWILVKVVGVAVQLRILSRGRALFRSHFSTR